MPLIFKAPLIPPVWARSQPGKSGSKPARSTALAEPLGLRVAVINNMPDAALEDTELQFLSLLDDASSNLPIYVTLFSLPGIPRAERGQSHVDKFYNCFDELWQKHFDGVIITGTEPKQPDLTDEPYWKVLAEVFDWAENNTASTVLSCLASHASVLHSDGIQRQRLRDKQFGVFQFTNSASHFLTAGTPEQICFPHSRWNEVELRSLTDCGYSVLTHSGQGGVDTFVKKKTKSLFVHFQGHPEYGAATLLKEYRRDIKRFIRGERETYPAQPKGYFDGASTKLVADFQEVVLAARRFGKQDELMAGFPKAELSAKLVKTWHSSATSIYRNWVHYLSSQKDKKSDLSVAVAFHHSKNPVPENVQRK